MVSLQTANTAWLAYGDSEVVPHPSLYISPFRSAEPSYPSALPLSESVVVTDHIVLHSLYPKYLTSFLSAYTRYPKAFTQSDRYTIFLPLSSPIVDELVRIQSENEAGFSHKNKKYVAESEHKIEQLLRHHMVPVKIMPHQIEYRSTTIQALESTISINQYGEINRDPSNRIESYLTFPHATIFFTTSEITN